MLAVLATDNGKQVTPSQLKRVQDRLRRLYKDENITPTELARRAGIPQPTLSAVVLDGKIGAVTVRRLALFFGETTEELLNGTHSAGYYTVREEDLAVGYPKRGRVLDGLRHVLPAAVLDEAQTIVLPHGSREWTELDWLNEIAAIANRRQRLDNQPEPMAPTTKGADGHLPKKRM